MRVEQSVFINRPVEDVFAFVSDPRHNEQWVAGVVGTEGVPEGPLVVGSTWRHMVKYLGRRFDVTFELTEHEHNRQSSVRNVGGPIPFHGRWTYEPADGGVRFIQVIEGEPGGFFRLAEPLVERAGNRQLAADLAMLKDLLEARE